MKYRFLQVLIPIPELCQYLWGNISVYPIGEVWAIVPIPIPSNLLSHYKLFREIDNIKDDDEMFFSEEETKEREPTKETLYFSVP
jgi:hypothetical protein